MIARLQHPYILPVYDFGTSSGASYIVLRYVEDGKTLAHRPAEPMPAGRAGGPARHPVAPWWHAHAHGFVHRDLKPGNVLLPEADWPLLADFGIARLMMTAATKLTSTGQIFGTPHYMAPEQALGLPVGTRCDLYSAGVVLYELVTGELPFPAAEDGVFWPCASEEHPGTPRLFLQSFSTPDGRARFHPVTHRPAAEEPDDTYPLWLTTGRVMPLPVGHADPPGGRFGGSRAARLSRSTPQTARALGISDTGLVRLVTRRGAAVVRARLCRTIRYDTLFAPFHWAGEARANLLTNPALDPASKMPELKVCAVRVEPLATGSMPSVHKHDHVSCGHHMPMLRSSSRPCSRSRWWRLSPRPRLSASCAWRSRSPRSS